MDVHEFHERLKAHCEKHKGPVVDCQTECELAEYCYAGPRGVNKELVDKVISLLESETPSPC